MSNEKIQDFGEKIGGAKKDLWKTNGLSTGDLDDMNLAECEKYVNKNNIWPKPNFEELYESGEYSKNALMFIKTMRDAIPTKPEIRTSDSEETIRRKQKEYIEFVQEFKDNLMNVRSDYNVDWMGIDYFVSRGYVEKSGWSSYEVTKSGQSFITNKLFKAIQKNSNHMELEVRKKNFLANTKQGIKDNFKVHEIDGWNTTAFSHNGELCIRAASGQSIKYYYPKDEAFKDASLYQRGKAFITFNNEVVFIGNNLKEAQQILNKLVEEAYNKTNQKEETKDEKVANKKPRKQALVPPQLANIKRDGPTVRNKNIEGQDFIDTFNIKGGEFGNWLNELDKQTNMNMAYDSFKDLAKALNIKDTDIAMEGKLSIAFGSRGSRGALAHYEPLREVINLTKMKGAGSLAHEYFHAMDDIANKKMNGKDFATDSMDKAFSDLVQAMKYKEVSDMTAIADAYAPKIKEAQDTYNAHLKDVEDYIEKLLPDNILTEKQRFERQYIIDDMQKNRATHEGRAFISNEVDKLNKLYREVKGENIPSSKEKLLKNWHYFIGKYNDDLSKITDERDNKIIKGETIKVETEFYKNAKKLDGEYSKSNHGYWASNPEMAARAFACYVQDKLAEQGIKNDYLTGHAENEKTAPPKKEREAIYKAFDGVISRMKELGIMHDRTEPVKEQNKQKPKNKDIER